MTNLRWKRLAALLAVITLIAAACGRDSDSGSSSDDSDSSDTTSADDSGGDEASGAFIDPDLDCDNYQGTAGIEGDTIKIGTIRPADGPYAIYDQVTTGLEAWVTSVNDNGGIKGGDGKSYQVELVKENDSYDPGKTPALAQKLVEQDGVFAIVGAIGTENNLAIRDYLNDNCVPNLALATGSPNWGDADQYPWYISGLPSYALEANYWLDYIADTRPEAKIALLYQDDDFGQAYKGALEKAIERSNSDNGTDIEIVGEQGYNPASGTTTEAAVTSLSQTGADVFIVGIGGTPCPLTLTYIPESWAPETYISVTCAGNTAMSIAGGKDVGVIQAQATLDPADPADADNEAVKEFKEKGAAAGLDEAQLNGGITSVGWGFGTYFGMLVENAQTVDRAGVMNTAFSLDQPAFGLIRPDIEIKTDGAEDPWGLEGFRIAQRNANGGWDELKPVVNRNGESNQLAG
ncbi:MAG: ABC transporter substrate-binding protein [Microthrixaceae bacterium]